jgi:soluble lytic murein transglycosylase-like protein
MPRARISSSNGQTVASFQGSGCLSGFFLPPLAVIILGLLFAYLVKDLDPVVQADSISNPASPDTTGRPGISPIFTAEVQYWDGPIARWAAAAGLNPNLVAVVMQIESCGDPRARSRSGAMGLFQVMPYHFIGTEDPYDPDTNALRGLSYLRRSLESAGGNARLALAGYNGGIGVITRAESSWSAETIRYVAFGAPIYADAVNGASTSATLDEWFDRYGASLCQQAYQRLGMP